MKKILITGASGFIGSFYVDEALKKGFEVWAGVRKTSSLEFLTDPAIHFIDLNYTDAFGLKDQIERHVAQNGKWDYVIHNAGITKCTDPSDFDRINFVYTKNLIDALKKSGNTPEKFMYMSSLGAFGPGDEKKYTQLRLTDTPNPNTAYGKSKIQAERYLQSQTAFPSIILRPTGVYGPREKDYFTMVKLIHAGLDVAVGFKPQLLNFIYIRDLTDVCFKAMESSLQNKVWFVADGDVYSSKAYTKIVKEALHKKFVFKIILPLFIVKIASELVGFIYWLRGKPSLLNPDKYQIMKQRNWSCEITSLQHDLGFEANYNLRAGMKETITWYKENGWL